MDSKNVVTAEGGAQKAARIIPWMCLLVTCAFILVLVFPASREVFRTLSGEHFMIMGFVKFAFLATVGELLAHRISAKTWALPEYLIYRMLIWGFLGAVLALMLKLYTGGVVYLLDEGLLPGSGNAFVKAFATSLLMNVTFGPVMMAFHKMTDTYLVLKHEGKSGGGVTQIAGAVDWPGFFSFVIMKTVPIFWVPAHTITFLLPAEYQTIMAAFLSMALGIILSLKK